MGKQTQSTGQSKALVRAAVAQMGWMVGRHLQPLGLMRYPRQTTLAQLQLLRLPPTALTAALPHPTHTTSSAVLW